ncbi:Class III signal peptide [Pyrobaculum oguniense TE7]|uniref:Class III signal peptide n=1 Tax=Pyrobaculum oguniense (strain DSM 13380 / JCM 10595 / TE7) TaxID=698757 RepID=H6QBP7_PYROT|nr:Class III signal peptide [Pyrobaculum oguniense TE7]
MPAKTRGMTSLEIAIIVAIVLIIAVAVGWYLYTTFVASTTGQPRLNIVSAEFSASDKELNITLVNPGPVDVQLSHVELAGKTYPISSCMSGEQTIQNNVIKLGQNATCTASIDLTLTPGTMVPGRVILSGGQSFPFNAIVKP